MSERLLIQRRLDVAFIVLYFGLGLPLQAWSAAQAPLPLMNYGPPLWLNAAVYMLAGPFVAFLLWRGKPRARSSVYMFCTFDVLRSARLGHWLPAAIDIAIVAYLQTPSMRHAYPSVWSRVGMLRRRHVWR